MIFDSHAHLNDDKLIGNLPQVLLDAQQNGVKYIICASYDLPSSQKAVNIATNHSQVYATVGMHPHDAKSYNKQAEQELIKFANNKRVVAWGEIGLDYHYDHSPRDVQQAVFARQIELAHQFGLPIIIHMREATQDTLNILQRHKHLLTNGGVMHCFSGSVETAKQALSLGLDISFAGPLTYKNARELIEVAIAMPIDRIHVETDCPYLAPMPLRGTINTPANTLYVAQKLADIKQIPLETLAFHTTQNTKRLFKIEF